MSDIWAKFQRERRYLRGALRTLGRVKSISPKSEVLICDDLEAAVDRFPQRPALCFEGRTLTYAQFDAMANRYAHWAVARGIKRGDVVALFMPNRLEYVPIWYGLSKVGVITALVNNQIVGAGLVHCLDICGATNVICDADTAPAFAAVRGQLARTMTEWIVGGGVETGAVRGDRDLDRTLKGVSALRPTRATARQGLVAGDTALFIYTSGTTGLPKAARVTHVRAQLYMRGFAASTESTPEDRIYNTLPLYHATGGLCGVGAALLSGGLLIIKRRFSATQFWTDIAEEKATMFVYIGELCRYLVNQPEQPGEHLNKVRLAFGNGLRGDVWEKMVRRFRIGRILEFYGATEGNVSIFNFDGKVGAVGRVPGYLRKRFNVRVIRHDPDTGEPIRDARGFCQLCEPGEVGETIGEIRSDDARANFTGYADKAATERKVLHDAFVTGDAYFRTGDLMRQDADGYFYFVDRIGDTFRWRGENVSTGEVGSRISAAPGVLEANVYGVQVPGAEGKAGMAALVVGPEFTLSALEALIDTDLPPYARPLFLRLQSSFETTGTFKYRKTDLVAQSFDPALVADPLYFRAPGGGFVQLDAQVQSRILAGDYRL